MPVWLRRERFAGQAVRFGVVGGINTIVDFGAFNLLLHVVGFPILVANTISVSLGITNSFFWNRYWTFSSRRSDFWRHEALVFLLVSGGGLLLNDAGVALLQYLFGGESILITNAQKLAASAVSMIWNFFGYRYLAFRWAGLRQPL